MCNFTKASIGATLITLMIISTSAKAENWHAIPLGSTFVYADKDSVTKWGNLTTIQFKLSMCTGLYTAKMNCSKAEIFDTDIGSYFECTKGGLPPQIWNEMYELACPRWYKKIFDYLVI